MDILVNNAGRATIESIEQMTEASWNDCIQLNLSSVFLMTQAVLPGMRARKWGRVINLTSVAAQAGSVMAVHYAAAKAGVIAMTKSYARLLAKEGVTVNAISPALIGTEMVASNPHIKPDMIPVGRFGRVEECADVAVLLARNAYITGQTNIRQRRHVFRGVRGDGFIYGRFAARQGGRERAASINKSVPSCGALLASPNPRRLQMCTN